MALVTQSLLSIDLHRFQYQQLYSRGQVSTDVDTLPDGFPIALTTNLAWNGPNLTDEFQYTYFLSSDQVLEIEAGLSGFKELGIVGDFVTRDNFPLPTLKYVLQVLCNELHNGKGFFVLRGLDPHRYSVADSMIIFLGIQSYLAEERARQDENGNMIVHITSDSSTVSSQATNLHARHSKKSIVSFPGTDKPSSPLVTNAIIKAFHTEETGDITAWQTRNTAARGGRCIISSAYTVYNILSTTRPDIIRTLAEPNWPFALPHFHQRPILFHHASHLIINFCRAALLGSTAHPRPAHLPSLTDAQLESLDVLEGVARAVELKITTQPGDLHFINNLAVLHRRDEFVDDNDDGNNDKAALPDSTGIVDMGSRPQGQGQGQGAARKRHLVRMRIRNPAMSWDLPCELRAEWEKAFAAEGDRIWHLEPMPEGFFPLRMNPH